MPRGPQGQKRPADAIGCAVMVGRIATGEITEVLKEPSGKRPRDPNQLGNDFFGSVLDELAHDKVI